MSNLHTLYCSEFPKTPARVWQNQIDSYTSELQLLIRPSGSGPPIVQNPMRPPTACHYPTPDPNPPHSMLFGFGLGPP